MTGLVSLASVVQGLTPFHVFLLPLILTSWVPDCHCSSLCTNHRDGNVIVVVGGVCPVVGINVFYLWECFVASKRVRGRDALSQTVVLESQVVSWKWKSYRDTVTSWRQDSPLLL